MRLIDADALKQHKGSYNPVKWSYEYGDVITVDDIDSAPTVDVAEVKHGKWIIRDNPGTAADIISAALAAYDAGLYELPDNTVQEAANLLDLISLHL